MADAVDQVLPMLCSPFECALCLAHLDGKNNTTSHYKSSNHKWNVSLFKSTFKNPLHKEAVQKTLESLKHPPGECTMIDADTKRHLSVGLNTSKAIQVGGLILTQDVALQMPVIDDNSLIHGLINNLSQKLCCLERLPHTVTVEYLSKLNKQVDEFIRKCDSDCTELNKHEAEISIAEETHEGTDKATLIKANNLMDLKKEINKRKLDVESTNPLHENSELELEVIREVEQFLEKVGNNEESCENLLQYLQDMNLSLDKVVL